MVLTFLPGAAFAAESGGGGRSLIEFLQERYGLYTNLVTLCEIPEFQNNRMGTYETNGILAETIREHILQYSVYHENHEPQSFYVTDELERQSDALLAAILDVWDDDPATRIFAVNRAGMEARFEPVALFPYTTDSDSMGFWDGWHHEGWFATHEIDENGERVQMHIDDILTTVLYELFGRGEGLGIHLSYVIAEHIMGTGSEGNPLDWCCRYTGFHHRFGELVGLENVFAAARHGQDYFASWMDEKIGGLHPDLTFTYDELQRAKVGVGNISRSLRLELQFSRRTGVTDVWGHFVDAWNYFYVATDPDFSDTERADAAQEFSQIIKEISDFSAANNLVVTWNYFCYCVIRCRPWHFQMPSVHDENLPLFDPEGWFVF